MYITRQQLVDHELFRAVLEVFPRSLRLRRLAKSPVEEGSCSKIIFDLLTRKPADSDIYEIFLHHWPEVLLKKTRDRLPRASHSSGLVRFFDDAIQMSDVLAIRLIERVIFPVLRRTYILILSDARKHVRKHKEFPWMNCDWPSYQFSLRSRPPSSCLVVQV